MRREFLFIFIVMFGLLMNPLLGYANNQFYLRSKASVSVEFLVEDVYWGTYGNPMSPEPGDRNVPLTVVIQQNSPYYLRGIIGYLYLPPGFIDSHSETNVSKASGIAIETDNDAHDIIPYGSFYLTFYLNLNNSLTKGTYNMTLNITYYVINNTIFLEGEPQIIRISVIIPNRAPEIYTVEPSNARVAVYAGDNKTFYIEAKDPDNDSLTYTWYLDGEKVGEGQNYTYFATEEDFGTHTLRVEVSDGDLTTSNTWTIDVEIPSETKIIPSTDHVYAGEKTTLTFTITNNLWHGTANIQVSCPDYVVVFGDTQWVINGLSPGDSVNISITVYVPKSVIAGVYGEIELIGQTMDVTISIDFTDEHGNTYSEEYTIGFIIRGRIILKFFDIRVEPAVAFPSDTVKISATVLNMGTATAQFCNASIMLAEFIELLAESFYYVGDVEPNSPTPFTLQFRVSPNADIGIRNVTIVFNYYDEMYDEYSIQFNVTIRIANKTSEITSEQPTTSLADYLPYIYVGLAIIAVVSVVVFIRRRRS